MREMIVLIVEKGRLWTKDVAEQHEGIEDISPFCWGGGLLERKSIVERYVA